MMLKPIKNITYFSKGKRGLIYTGIYKNMKVAIKVKKPESEAKNRIENEANYLKLLNKYKIGPEFVMFKNKKLVYKFVEGEFIDDFLKKSPKPEIIKILASILKQCYQMDQLKINKEEMHHPYKHILIRSRPVFIDFERTHKTESPKNVTQFCQFIISKRIQLILKEKKIKINRKTTISSAKRYKNKMNKENFKKIIDLLKN
ncbi:MAG: hypothetical protein ABII01_06085 [Candidatus Woesearchaeota archaeon]